MEATLQILEHLWVLFIAVGGWCVNKLIEKISDLDKGKATADEVGEVKEALQSLDRRVGNIDHSIQLRLVPRSEIKADIILLHTRVNELSEKLCGKEDRIQTIRVTNEEVRNGGKA